MTSAFEVTIRTLVDSIFTLIRADERQKCANYLRECAEQWRDQQATDPRFQSLNGLAIDIERGRLTR